MVELRPVSPLGKLKPFAFEPLEPLSFDLDSDPSTTHSFDSLSLDPAPFLSSASGSEVCLSGMSTLSAPIPLALGMEIGSLGELDNIGVGIRGLHKKPTRLLVSMTLPREGARQLAHGWGAREAAEGFEG